MVPVPAPVMPKGASPTIVIPVALADGTYPTPNRNLTTSAKVWHLRVFEGADGRMDLPVAEVGGAVLVISQFTLYGDTRKGRRPSWTAAARPDHAEPLVQAVVDALRRRGAHVETGEFGAMMRVHSVNDGPFTVLVEV